MSIPNRVTALANHKGAAIVHAGGMLIPVKIMDISHEESAYRGSATEFKCLVVDSSAISPKEFVNHAMKPAYDAAEAKQIARSIAKACCYTDGVEPGYLARRKAYHFEIDHVTFAGDTDTVFWKDGTKTAIVCPKGDLFTKEDSLGLHFTLKRIGLSQIIFNNPVTVALWEDGTKTIVRCQESDIYSKETGLFTVIAKKTLGNKGNFNDVFKKHIPEY